MACFTCIIDFTTTLGPPRYTISGYLTYTLEISFKKPYLHAIKICSYIFPELERAIAERAKRLEQAEQPPEDDGTNPTLTEVRARLRHAAPASPAASAH